VAFEARALHQAIHRLTGTIEQVPPMHSAIKHEGRALYELARKGVEVDRAARRVTIHRLEVVRWQGDELVLDIACSKGTYVRTLAEDLGAALGCGAHLAALTRTAVGPFTLADAVAPEAVTPAHLRPADALVADLPRRALSDAEREAVVHGRAIAGTGAGTGDGGRVALFHGGELVAVADAAVEQLKPCVVVADA
jgi:tRNA pseudouridine55 synthase